MPMMTDSESSERSSPRAVVASLLLGSGFLAGTLAFELVGDSSFAQFAAATVPTGIGCVAASAVLWPRP